MAWQMTSANIDRRHKLQKAIATIELTALDLWRVFHQNWSIRRSSYKTMAWKMTGANIGRCQESQKTIVINEFSTFKLFSMQSFVENG